MSTSAEEIVLTPEQKLHVARLAEQMGRPWEAVLDEALAAYQPRVQSGERNGGESYLSAATRLSFIGSIQGGPADLSINPKYMKGFGKSGS
jgi:hypothetical protein